MRLEGGCYCGAVRYVAEGEPLLRAQCHCRACQHISGGAPNLFMLMPAEGFAYTKGAPATYTRPDKSDAVTREFCAVCGTHMITRRPGLPPVVLKIGTLTILQSMAARKWQSSRRNVSHSISSPQACPSLKDCRRADDSNHLAAGRKRTSPNTLASPLSVKGAMTLGCQVRRNTTIFFTRKNGIGFNNQRA
jgi:hypothetical protein